MQLADKKSIFSRAPTSKTDLKSQDIENEL
jgi:hypothetical protein